jgi:hypothetical protein
VLFTKYWDDEVKERKLGGACSMHGTDEKCVPRFGWVILKLM